VPLSSKITDSVNSYRQDTFEDQLLTVNEEGIQTDTERNKYNGRRTLQRSNGKGPATSMGKLLGNDENLTSKPDSQDPNLAVVIDLIIAVSIVIGVALIALLIFFLKMRARTLSLNIKSLTRIKHKT